MKYKRMQVFTLTNIMNQIVDYLKEMSKIPTKIELPPEEYLYINYIVRANTVDLALKPRIKKFLGIPLTINKEKQDKPFQF